jgi:hypothetical protein
LEAVIEEREEYAKKQSTNGFIGQFWKKAKGILNKKTYDKLRKLYEEKNQDDFIKILNEKGYAKAMDKASLEAMLIDMLKHLEDEIEIEDEIINEDSSFSLLLSFLEKSVNDLPVEKSYDSKTFHNSVFNELKTVGYNCFYEFAIPHGRIDILVKLPDGINVAIELDRKTPRPKNLIKVEGLDCKIISILREPYPNKSYKQFNVDGLVLYRGNWAQEVEIVGELSFDNAWELYGKKGNKKTSEKKWANLKNHCREAALKHIPRYVASTPDIQYRKNFETYINQEVWNDEIITKNNGNTTIQQGSTGINQENKSNSFRTDAERRRAERKAVGDMARAILQQPSSEQL